MKTPVAFLLAVPLLSGCEGYRCAQGKVLDKVTGSPLDSVFCEVLTGRQAMYTDSTGRFDVCNTISGCVPKCKDITVRFSKNGYKTFSVENPEDSVIYMER